MCEVMVLPAIVQIESTVMPVADFCTSRLEQLAPDEDACDCMAWSVAASMHCFIVMGWLATWVVISHRPALREGMSAAAAGIANAATRSNTAPERFMASSPSESGIPDRL